MLNSNANTAPSPKTNPFGKGMSRTSKPGYWVNVDHIPLTIEQMWHNMLLMIHSNPKKYVLGLAFYARSFKYFKDPTAPSYTSTGLYEGFTTGSAMSYAELMGIEGQYTTANLTTVSANGDNFYGGNQPHEVYKYNNDTFISYDNQVTIAAKSTFARQQKMAGIMTFHLGGDHFGDSNEPGALQKAAVKDIWAIQKPEPPVPTPPTPPPATTAAPTAAPTAPPTAPPTPAPSPAPSTFKTWMWGLIAGIVLLLIAALVYWRMRRRRARREDVEQPRVPPLYIDGATVVVERADPSLRSKILTWDGKFIGGFLDWTIVQSKPGQPEYLQTQIGTPRVLHNVYTKGKLQPVALGRASKSTEMPKRRGATVSPGSRDDTNDPFIVHLKL